MGWERVAHGVRWVMVLPVLGLLLGSFYFAFHALLEAVKGLSQGLEAALKYFLLGALAAAVFLIFSLGLFELFIHKLDLPLDNVLLVKSLADLKAKLGQVIVMILVVKFFEKALAFQPKEALDFCLFAGGVALLAGALWVSARE